MIRYWQKRKFAVMLYVRSVLAALALLCGISRTLGTEVTLRGSVVCGGACIPEPKAGDHGLVIFPIDGTAEVRATVEQILKDFYPDRALDAEAAQTLMDQFSSRLKYHIAADSPALKDAKNRADNHYCMPATASVVTGTVTERDGKSGLRPRVSRPAS
jgi:hypothetical protein